MSPILSSAYPTAYELHQACFDLLTASVTATVYSGTVPDNVSAEAGTKRVYPYAVLWANTGSFPTFEAEPLSDEDSGELLYEARVTVASGDPMWTLLAAGEVRKALSRTRLLPRAGLLREPEGSNPSVQEDSDPDPVRWFVPLVFTTMSA